MANKTKLTWINPTENTDGSAYNAATENAGYELSLDGNEAAIALPLSFGTEYDMKDLDAYKSLGRGNHTVALRVVNRQGVASDFTAPVPFLKELYPNPPTAFGVG